MSAGDSEAPFTMGQAVVKVLAPQLADDDASESEEAADSDFDVAKVVLEDILHKVEQSEAKSAQPTSTATQASSQLLSGLPHASRRRLRDLVLQSAVSPPITEFAVAAPAARRGASLREEFDAAAASYSGNAKSALKLRDVAAALVDVVRRNRIPDELKQLEEEVESLFAYVGKHATKNLLAKHVESFKRKQKRLVIRLCLETQKRRSEGGELKNYHLGILNGLLERMQSKMKPLLETIGTLLDGSTDAEGGVSPDTSSVSSDACSTQSTVEVDSAEELLGGGGGGDATISTSSAAVPEVSAVQPVVASADCVHDGAEPNPAAAVQLEPSPLVACRDGELTPPRSRSPEPEETVLSVANDGSAEVAEEPIADAELVATAEPPTELVAVDLVDDFAVPTSTQPLVSRSVAAPQLSPSEKSARLAARANSKRRRKALKKGASVSTDGGDSVRDDDEDAKVALQSVLANGSRALRDSLFNRAKELLTQAERMPLAKKVLNVDEQSTLTYCLGRALTETTLVEDKVMAKEKLDGLLQLCQRKKRAFPLTYLALAKLSMKQADYAIALEEVEEGLRSLDACRSGCQAYYYPGGENVLIAESPPEVLREQLAKVRAACLDAPPPVFVCRGDNCETVSIRRRRDCFAGEPGFVGYAALLCADGCRIAFHFPHCWRELEKRHGGRKAVVNGTCLTPDCGASVHKLVEFDSALSARNEVLSKVALEENAAKSGKHRGSADHERLASKKAFKRDPKRDAQKAAGFGGRVDGKTAADVGGKHVPPPNLDAIPFEREDEDDDDLIQMMAMPVEKRRPKKKTPPAPVVLRVAVKRDEEWPPVDEVAEPYSRVVSPPPPPSRFADRASDEPNEAVLRNLESQPGAENFFSLVVAYVNDNRGRWVPIAELEDILLGGPDAPAELSLLVSYCGDLASVLRRQRGRFNFLVSDDAVCLPELLDCGGATVAWDGDSDAAADTELTAADEQSEAVVDKEPSETACDQEMVAEAPPPLPDADEILSDANSALNSMAQQMRWQPVGAPQPPRPTALHRALGCGAPSQPTPSAAADCSVHYTPPLRAAVVLPPMSPFVLHAATATDAADDVQKLHDENEMLKSDLQKCSQQASLAGRINTDALRAAKQEAESALTELASTIARYDDLRQSKEKLADELHTLRATHAELQATDLTNEMELNRLKAELTEKSAQIGTELRRASESDRRAMVAEVTLLEMRRRVEMTSLQTALQDAMRNLECTGQLLGRLRQQPRNGLLQAAEARFVEMRVQWENVVGQMHALIRNADAAFGQQIDSVNAGVRLADLAPVVVPPPPPGPAIPDLNDLLAAQPLPPAAFEMATPPRLLTASQNGRMSVEPTVPIAAAVVDTRPVEPPRRLVEHASTSATAPASAPAIATTEATPPPAAVAGGGAPKKIDQLKEMVREQFGAFEELEFRQCIPLARAALGGTLSGHGLKQIADRIVITLADQRYRASLAVGGGGGGGATEQQRPQPPVETTTVACSAADLGDERECCICHEDMERSNAPLERCRACSKIFHQRCLETWLNTNATCPQCRTHMRLDRDFPALGAS